MFAVSMPQTLNNMHRNGVRNDCRNELEKNYCALVNNSSCSLPESSRFRLADPGLVEDCGYTGLGIRREIPQTTSSFDTLKLSMGACMEYSDGQNDTLQPSPTRHGFLGFRSDSSDFFGAQRKLIPSRSESMCRAV